LLSRAAFPKQLGSDNDDLTITLKYPCRSYDASIVWAGLRVTKDNPDTWRRLLSKNSEVIELRVLMGDIDQDTETVERPLTGLDGIPLKLHFHRASGTSWTVAADPVPAPATYRVSVILFEFERPVLINKRYRVASGKHLQSSSDWVFPITQVVLPIRLQKDYDLESTMLISLSPLSAMNMLHTSRRSLNQTIVFQFLYLTIHDIYSD